MKQKMIALAVATLFSAPVLAGTVSSNGDITLYGKVFLTADQFDDGVVGHSSVTRVNSNASRFGVKGKEDLGGGLAGIFQYEIQVDGDGSGGNGFGNGTRNSGVGLEGGFGKIIIGRWDSPLKVAHNKIELFDNTTDWSATKVVGKSEGKDYNTRHSNQVQYWTPKFGGAQLAVQYVPDEKRDNVTAGSGNKYDFSTSLTYNENGVYLSGAYELRNDQTVVGKDDNAFRAVGRYTLGDVWVGAMLESIKTNLSAVSSETGTNWELAGEYKFGASRLGLSYARAGSTATGAAIDNDVSQIAAKLTYAFSKRTEAFAAYANRDINKSNSKANDIGVGVIHSF